MDHLIEIYDQYLSGDEPLRLQLEPIVMAVLADLGMDEPTMDMVMGELRDAADTVDKIFAELETLPEPQRREREEEIKRLYGLYSMEN